MNLPLCVSELVSILLRIQKIILLLIQNQIKNSLDANSKSIIIRINKSKNVIQIIDNGSGISEEHLKNIWKM